MNDNDYRAKHRATSTRNGTQAALMAAYNGAVRDSHAEKYGYDYQPRHSAARRPERAA